MPPRLLIAIVFSLLLGRSLCAQEVPIYSQYILNQFILNPSMAGYDGMITVNLTGRKQWLGLNYTPETYSAAISARILKSPFSIHRSKIRKGSEGRVGLGMVATADIVGAVQRTIVRGSYAYHIFLDNKQLSFGASLMMTQLNINKDLVNLKSANDPTEGILGKSGYFPDADFGISLESQKYTMGFSVSNLLASSIQFGNLEFQKKDLRQQRNYMLFGEYTISSPSSDWYFEPSGIVRFDEQLHASMDVTGRIIYQHQYWLGLSYRTSGEFVLLVGIKINRIYFGYSFDYGFNPLSRMTFGSHEVSVAIKLGDSSRRYRWHERY